MEEIIHIEPKDIEKTSFAIITKELKEQGKLPDPLYAPIILRAIHTTADFSYFDTLTFSAGVLDKAKEALTSGATIITDTNMTLSGINKRTLGRFGGKAVCFMADQEVAKEAKERGVTRATVSMEKAMALKGPLIFAIGNAPTALLKLYEEIQNGFLPSLIIGVPVGFVNVVPAKERILTCDVPYIVNRGRKGGSNVAAAICNALLYGIDGKR